MLAGLGYAEPVVRRLWALATATLEGAHGPMTREELADRICARGGACADVLRHSWGIALRPLATEGLICFGPLAGRMTTFVLTERWLGQRPAVGGDPLQQLALAYLRAYGPATVTDFAFWSGLPVRQARTAFAALDSSLTSVGGGWLAYKDVFGKAGRIAPTILAGGRVVGTWGYKRRASRVDIECASFGDVSLSEAALRTAAGHLAGHWCLPVAVQVRRCGPGQRGVSR